VLALALSLATLPASAATKVDRRFNIFSSSADIEIGQRSAAQAERQLPIVTNRAVNDFVTDVGRALARQAPGPKFPYRFKVVNAADLNAFALPGGFIYINRGVIEAAGSEGEVAGVLAHEIAHVALRHGTHQASKAYVAQAGVGLLGRVLGQGGRSSNGSEIIETVGGFGLNVLFLKHSREMESEADLLGSQILARAGYDPRGMASFFRTIDRAGGNRGLTASWLSSHPAPSRRVDRVHREAATLAVGSSRSRPTTSFAAARTALRRMAPARTTSQIRASN
jgi:predicted Zn-dependent protease